MPDVQDYDLAYSKKREQAERQASALAKDMCAKAVHRSLALLYGDRVISARRAIDERCLTHSASDGARLSPNTAIAA